METNSIIDYDPTPKEQLYYQTTYPIESLDFISGFYMFVFRTVCFSWFSSE